MSTIDEIRKRAENGIATLADVKDLIGQLDRSSQKPAEVVYVPDNAEVAKQVQAKKDRIVAIDAERMKAGVDAGKAAQLSAEREKLAAELRKQAGL